MANFDVQIQELSGTFDDQVALDQWMTDGAKEIINQLSAKLKEKCMTITNLYIGNTDTTMDMDGKGDVLYVTRENADSGVFAPCRKIPSMYGDLTNDSDNIIYGATSTDPIYYIESNSSSVSTLFVKPTPTSLQPAKVYHIGYPTIDASSVAVIANFPDEAEYLVVLYAAIKVVEQLMLTEEDQEVYAPQLATLKQDYAQGIAALKGGQ